MSRPSSVEEFERQYAERSGVTVEWLHEHGRYGATCDCGDEICEGWQMTRRDYERGSDGQDSWGGNR